MVLVGYVGVSKSDGSQSLEPQRDALLAAGVAPERVYEDLTPGRQRGYLLFFSSAKQANTREARIDKCAPQIPAGKGWTIN